MDGCPHAGEGGDADGGQLHIRAVPGNNPQEAAAADACAVRAHLSRLQWHPVVPQPDPPTNPPRGHTRPLNGPRRRQACSCSGHRHSKVTCLWLVFTESAFQEQCSGVIAAHVKGFCPSQKLLQPAMWKRVHALGLSWHVTSGAPELPVGGVLAIPTCDNMSTISL